MFRWVNSWRELGYFRRSSIGLIMINVFLQRILRISGKCRYLIHFTSRATSGAGIELYGEGINAERCLAINGGMLLGGSNGIKIHRSVLIAPGVKFVSGNHDFSDFNMPTISSEPIVISENCWIGANAIILPGISLLPDTIVGAGSVVTKSPGEPGVVVCGNPAKIIRRWKNCAN